MGKKVALATVVPVIVLSIIGLGITGNFSNVHNKNDSTKATFDTDPMKERYPNFYTARDGLIAFYMVMISNKLKGYFKGLFSVLYIAILIIFGLIACLYISNPEEKVSLSLQSVFKQKTTYDMLNDDSKKYYKGAYDTYNSAVVFLIAILSLGIPAAGFSFL